MKRISAIAFLCLLFLVIPGSAEPHSGHTNWGPWSFDWAVRDKAGLALLNVRYNGHTMIYKGSLPVIRVRYEPEPDGNICGPYADRIVWGNFLGIGPHLIPIGGRCGGKKVCQSSSTIGGVDWLEMAVYARIGAYHLYQSWMLSSDGQIDVKLFSKGLSCNADHDHHPYWRFDFDVDGASGDQILRYDRSPSGNYSSFYYLTEQNDLKDPSLDRIWYVRDQTTSNRIWVTPGANDGPIDPYGFCTKMSACGVSMVQKISRGPSALRAIWVIWRRLKASTPRTMCSGTSHTSITGPPKVRTNGTVLDQRCVLMWSRRRRLRHQHRGQPRLREDALAISNAAGA